MTTKRQCLDIIHELHKTAEDPIACKALDRAFWKIVEEIEEPEITKAWWEPIKNLRRWNEPLKRWYCSNCRRVVDKRTRYCPGCGSEMECE